jgi:hypothetical protein
MGPYPGCRCSPKRSAGSITYYSTRHLLLLYVGSNAILHHSPDVRAHVAPMFRAQYGFADELHATLTRRDSVPIRLEASLASICTSPEIFTCAWCLDSRDPCPSVVAVNSTPIHPTPRPTGNSLLDRTTKDSKKSGHALVGF